MRVVQGHAAHAAETAERAGALVAIHGAEFGNFHGQIAIAAQLRLVDEDMVRAVHGPQHHLLGLEVHGREHVLVIVGPVAGALVEVDLGEVGRVDVLVAEFALEAEDVVLQQAADGCAFGEPERQAGADFFADGEELEFLAEAAVVAALRVFDALEVVVEVFLREEGGAVNALELRVLLVAEPIGTRQAHDLEGLDAAGGGDVRAAAEVDELAVAVEGDFVAGLRELLDEVDLHEVVAGFEFLEALLARLQFANEFLIARGDLGHAAFDELEVLGREGRGTPEIVEEAGLGGGAMAELRLRKQLRDGGGHDVGGGVAQDLERVGSLSVTSCSATSSWSGVERSTRRSACVSSAAYISASPVAAEVAATAAALSGRMRATTAACARRGEMLSAMDRGVVPDGTSRTDPSGSWT